MAAPVAALTYQYAASRVEVRPLGQPTTGSYQLCQAHLDRLRLPQGWTLVVAPGAPVAPDLPRLAAAIRRAGGVGPGGVPADADEPSLTSRPNLVTLAARAHLRVVADAASYTPKRK